MKRKEAQAQKDGCEHLWTNLGSSSHNGKTYRRCEKCGVVKEDRLTYIV